MAEVLQQCYGRYIAKDTRAKIKFKEVPKLKPETPEEMWAIVKGTSDLKGLTVKPTKNRKGWRTVRIFVSSTFKDFYQEREVLVKEVFPDLRLWCEQRKIRLVECDLRWGVPKDTTSEETIKICLEELDRCYQDNVAPFFLNLAGERSGWIPSYGSLTHNVAARYGWVYGLSVTEMEIVHGAFRKLNPNALFMIREAEDLNSIPDDQRVYFVDKDPNCINKIRMLKHMIQSSFPPSNVFHYKVKAYRKSNGEIDFDGLRGADAPFRQQVYGFFKSRIETLYPLDLTPEDPLQVQRDAHEVRDYVLHGTTKAPLMVIGLAGAGKSAVMAKIAHDIVTMAKERQIRCPRGFKKWRVFFHFVGATPGSTDLALFLQRLTKEVKPDLKDIASDLDSLIQLSASLLSNPNTEPVVIFVDAINQIDEDKQQFLRRWLPEKLSPNVRVVVSMIEGTPSHQMLRTYKTGPREIVCGSLDVDFRKAIVKNILSVYGKRLDSDQMESLVRKDGSSNPLWLTLACDELRVFGQFDMVLNKIESLPNDLTSLETSIFSRFEEEAGGKLMVATLCLLEVSRHGLLETELLALLGDTANITVPEYVEEETEAIVSKTEGTLMDAAPPVDVDKDELEEITDKLAKMVDDAYVVKDEADEKRKEGLRRRGKQIVFLPAREWAVIYRNLKQLLRPCGDLGEGRLDFYHRSLSKAVRKKYFSGTDEYKKHVYNFWHGVLAGYFENVDDMDRKAEELPYHLEQLLDNNRLTRCLLEWPVFDRLFSEDFSIDLLHAWQKAGGYSVAAAMYNESLEVLKNSPASLVDYANQMKKVITFLIQAGQYSHALDFLKEREKLEVSTLGSRADEMADIYNLLAKCKSEIVKNYGFVSEDQLDENKEVITYCRKSMQYRNQLAGEEHEFKLAMTNMMIALHLSLIAMSHDDSYRTEALQCIDNAISTFEKSNDIGHLAEAIMTKSFVYPRLPRYFKEKKELLMSAKDLCIKAYGENHLLACRLYLNIGILYEDLRYFQESYDYFVKWHETCLNVLGPDHPKTKRAEDTLNEKEYVQIRQEREGLAAGTG